MITQYVKQLNIEIIKKEMFEGDELSAQEKYNKCLKYALRNGNTLVLPCTGEKIVIGKPKSVVTNPDEPYYVKDGRYSRDVIDFYKEVRPDGKTRIHFYKTSVRIQQIEASSGHHHAVLGNFVVPYEEFTVTSALYLLAMYYSTSQTPEEFCDGFTDIEITVGQLKRLIAWAEKMFPLLEIDTTPAKETEAARRQAYREGVLIILKKFQYYHELCIRINKMALFQKRKPVCSPFITGMPFDR